MKGRDVIRTDGCTLCGSREAELVQTPSGLASKEMWSGVLIVIYSIVSLSSYVGEDEAKLKSCRRNYER